MSFAIKAQGLGKKYIISHQRQGRYETLRDTLACKAANALQWLKHPLSVHKSNVTLEEFWALKDIDFEIKQGDRVGIIGRNGAGKSTLLKILSRITEPTTGKVQIKGRISSLLEVGTGFHPELTGRENIYLNGSILGMSRKEIRAKFDEIIDFAEIEKFLDTPVKRYSSGMYVRLAFAIAAHLEPEILIVDEVLAVGDLRFQKKCLGKMKDAGREGKTVLFVSHSMEAIRKLCKSCILLDQGELLTYGKTASVIESYLQSDICRQSEFTIPTPVEKDIPGYAYKLTIENADGKEVSEIPIGSPWQIRLHVKLNKPIKHFIAGLGFFTEYNMPLRTCWSKPQDMQPGEYHVVFKEEILHMASGIYPLLVGLSSNLQVIQYVEDAGYLRISEISDNLDLVKVENVGLILNQTGVEFIRL